MRTCNKIGCTNKHFAKGMCQKHYGEFIYKQNPELFKARAAKYKAENKKKVKDTKTAYYSSERAKELGMIWRAENPERWRAIKKTSEGKRSARKAAAGSTLTTQEWVEVWEEFGGLCFWCGAEATSMDHIVPLNPRSEGQQGHHTKGNVVPACGPCNNKKYNKDPLTFYFEMVASDIM